MRLFINLLISFCKISVDIISNICQLFTVLFLICSQFKADEDTQVKLREIFIQWYPINQFLSFCIVIMGDEPEITQVEKIPWETLPRDRTLNRSVITMTRRKIKMAKKMKGKSLLKRKTKGLERENTVHPRMNQIVIVMKIDHQGLRYWQWLIIRIFKGRNILGWTYLIEVFYQVFSEKE